MKRFLTLSLAFSLFCALIPSNSFAAAKAGSPCSKVKSISVSAGKVYTCVKSGKKLVWNKGEVISQTLSYDTAPASTAAKPEQNAPLASKWPVPSKLPTSFENLFENRAGISYAVWQRTSAIMAKNATTVPPIEILVGPNTTPWSTNHEDVVKLVSSAFSKQINPKKLYIVFHNYTDKSWAESKLKEILPSDEYSDWLRNDGGVAGNCQDDLKDCLGAKIKTSRNNEMAFLLLGVSNQVGMLEINGSKYGNIGVEEMNKKGMLVAHEFIHTLQMGPIANKQTYDLKDRPPSWMWEGTATLFQNLAVNSSSYQDYMNYRKKSLGEFIERQGIQEEFVKNYMDQKNWLADPWRGGQSIDWSYQLGARIMEILVAIKGPDSALEIFDLMSQKTGFEASFKLAFGISYEDAVPLIAKTIAANWKAGL
jgi:hypothetical protein